MTIVQILASEFGIGQERIEKTVELLDGGNTVPFIARYRKEVTGGLDDTLLRGLSERLAYLRLLYRYVAASNMINSGWDYPTKQQLSQYSRLLNVMLSSSRSYRGERLRTQYALMEKVLDIKDSPAGRNDTTSFAALPTAVSFLLNKEPGMDGGLRMACVASDALTLQYYEEPDDRKAAFGHKLTRQDWEAIAAIKDRYQDILFGLPTMAVNVAHPMLQELLSELREPGRRFTFLCGHDSNIGSVLAALRAEPYSAPGAIETKTPIGGKIVFGKYRGRDGRMYADLWLVYASADQLRGLAVLGPDCPPMSLPLRLSGLTPNADGLYLLSDLEARFTEAIDLYETF